ncbi:MAG: DUF2318 domain-containing protein [Lachnospiraceae bacterium]|nr:DUF2318 domain-containing protein [Lachnospiraceae bacterium]
MALLALIVVVFIPKGTNEGRGTASAGEDKASTSSQAEINEGNLVIYADRLSSDQISFIRISEDSHIELLARLGDDGTVKAALGTCQSCNGSPGAYYTQEGDELKCNNCGLTFPISVLDRPGGGCHPIMLKEEIVRYEGNNLVIDLGGLSAYEDLFSKVADH